MIDLKEYYDGRYADCEHNLKKLFDDMTDMIRSLSFENEKLREALKEKEHG